MKLIERAEIIGNYKLEIEKRFHDVALKRPGGLGDRLKGVFDL
jgi:hypothetical protein